MLNLKLRASFNMTFFVLVLTFVSLLGRLHSTECGEDILVTQNTYGAPSVGVAQPFLTAAETQFGGLIEATAVDKSGSIFATAFRGSTYTLGQASGPNRIQQDVFFNDTSNTAFFNGLRFLPLPKCLSAEGITSRALAADVKGHRVVTLLKNKAGKVTSTVFCQDSTMVQPNDIAIATRAGRVYTSGQKFTSDTVIGDGDLWMCEAPGFQSTVPVRAHRLGVFGRTNGIEVSPDEKTLYLSEAFNKNNSVVSNVVWKFTIDPSTGHVSDKTLFVDFQKLDGSEAVDVDGMRTDMDANLFITRNGNGEVLKFSPEGEVLLRIQLAGIHNPTNLELGGTDGTSLFIVGSCKEDGGKGCVDVWNSNAAPGRAFVELNARDS